VGFATVSILTIALAVAASLIAVNDAATSGSIGISGDIRAQTSAIQPDTADIVNILIVPVALDGVAADKRIDVVGEDIDMIDTVILNLKEIIVLRFVVGVNIVHVAVVNVVDVPVVVGELVTIAEGRAFNLTRDNASAGEVGLTNSGVALSLLATAELASSTTAEQVGLFAAVPRVTVAIEPARIASERAETRNTTEVLRALNNSSTRGTSLRGNVGVSAGQPAEDLAVETGRNRVGDSSAVVGPVNNVEITVVVRLHTNGTLVETLESNNAGKRAGDAGDGGRTRRLDGKVVAEGDLATSLPFIIIISANLNKVSVGDIRLTASANLRVNVGASAFSSRETSTLATDRKLSAEASILVDDTRAIVVAGILDGTSTSANLAIVLAAGLDVGRSGLVGVKSDSRVVKTDPVITTVDAICAHTGLLGDCVVGKGIMVNTAEELAVQAQASTAVEVGVVVVRTQRVLRVQSWIRILAGSRRNGVGAAVRAGVGQTSVEEGLATVGRISITINPTSLTSKLAAARAEEIPGVIATLIAQGAVPGAGGSTVQQGVYRRSSAEVLVVNLARIRTRVTLRNPRLVNVEPRTLLISAERPIHKNRQAANGEGCGIRQKLGVIAIPGGCDAGVRENVVTTNISSNRRNRDNRGNLRSRSLGK